MFNKEQEQKDNKEAETIIGQSVIVKGNFHGKGNIIIEGIVEGSVKTDAFLLVGSKAKISADINAKNAKIGGNISGNILIEGYLEIKASAVISGDIRADQISVEKGAAINGNCAIGKEKTTEKSS